MIINTNPGAAMAARILGESSSALQKSLSRLSSGSKIASPSDDAAGTGVAMKFGAQINRIQAAKDNVGNAIAYAQTQDGFLEKVGSALDRMSELAMLAQDETKTMPTVLFMTRSSLNWKSSSLLSMTRISMVSVCSMQPTKASLLELMGLPLPPRRLPSQGIAP